MVLNILQLLSVCSGFLTLVFLLFSSGRTPETSQVSAGGGADEGLLTGRAVCREVGDAFKSSIYSRYFAMISINL